MRIWPRTEVLRPGHVRPNTPGRPLSNPHPNLLRQRLPPRLPIRPWLPCPGWMASTTRRQVLRMADCVSWPRAMSRPGSRCSRPRASSGARSASCGGDTRTRPTNASSINRSRQDHENPAGRVSSRGSPVSPLGESHGQTSSRYFPHPFQIERLARSARQGPSASFPE